MPVNVATVENTELVDRFDQFFRNYYREAIGQLAQRYPNEQRSLTVDWTDLYQFDADLADDYVAQPDQLREYAEEALRLHDLPVDVSLGQAHVRLENLDEVTDIRAIRARDVNRLVSVQGIVRKATDVRPKVQEAAFECQRCGTLTYIPQSGAFQEPHECQGCERQGPFTINYDQSTFVDAQKLRVQERPEGLRGGETPQSLDVHIEDDLTGRVAPGDHVTVTGVLRIEQQTNQRQKSRMFDVHMEGHSIVIEDEEFEDMDITDADKRDIVELSQRGEELYGLFVDSIAPSIYGFDDEKLALTLQLFSGVTKRLPDETRIRGDFHILLIGDPGTGKCVSGDTKVTLGDGSEIEIRELVEDHLDDPIPVDDGVYQPVDFQVPSLKLDGSMAQKRATKVWKREAPDRMYRIRTASGRKVEVTPSHPLYVQEDGHLVGVKAENLLEGQFIATPRQVPTVPGDSLDIEYRRSRSNNAVTLDLPEAWTPSLARLVGYIVAEGHVVLRDDHTGDVRVTNNDWAVLEDVKEALSKLGLPYTVDPPRRNKTARRVRCNSGEFASFLANLEPAILERSANQRVPDAVMRASLAIKRAFLKAYIEGEGTVSTKEREISVSSMSRELIEGVRSLLTAIGIGTQLEARSNGSFRLRISGNDFVTYVREIGFVTERKVTATRAFDDVPQNPNNDVVPGVGEELRRVREALALSQFDCGLPRSTYQHYERGDRNPSRRSFQRVVAAFKRRLDELRAHYRAPAVDWANLRHLRKAVKLSQQTLADEIGIEQTSVSQYERGVVPDGGHVEAAGAVVDTRIEDAIRVADAVHRLDQLAQSDVRWDRIESIEQVEPEDEWVYDLEVEDAHNYLTNGIVSHNSQLLQYIRHIAPRSVYTSGKGSSAAGITAAAVKDDFGDGQQWSLEAGALVLADMGIAAVDELDKMRCVTGETLVHLDDEIVPIRELAIRAERAGSIEEHEHGRTIRELDESVYTMTESGRIVSRPVTALHEYDAPSKLVEVTLESGEKLRTTADHPFFVLEDGARIEEPAAGLSKGDWVYVPQEVRQAATDGGAAARSAPDMPESPDHLTPSHGAILGYMAGDGDVVYDRSEGAYGIRFTNKEAELIEHFKSACMAAFGSRAVVYPSDRREDGVDTATLRSKAVVDELFDLGAGLGRYDQKRLPIAVTGASRATKAAFIRSFADSDGWVDIQTGNVKLGSTSYSLLLGIKELLLEFGISSQIQFRPRSERRDFHILAITSKAAVEAYREHIGFTLTRKQQALETVCEQLSGDRTIIDVLPDCGPLFKRSRTALRLHQHECGISDATYCNFENGDANASFIRGEAILSRFEERTRQAKEDATELDTSCPWFRLEELRQRYHVTQEEIAAKLSVSQQYISEHWGGNPELRERIENALRDIVLDVEQVDLEPLRQLIRGDVKWRRVVEVERIDRDGPDDDRIPILKHRLADLLELSDEEAAVRTAREILRSPPNARSWSELRSCLEQHAISFQEIADHLDVANSTISRWFSGAVDVGNFEEVREACFDVIGRKRGDLHSLIQEIDDRGRPKVYDLTVEGTHNYIANGMVVHNSEDRSALHQALEQQEISVSKAGINATLKARCALLGAANPKYGRFDQYEPIAEQIDLEPALISRFDLIFTVTDAPDEERDGELADHILRTNYAGELRTQRDQLASPMATEADVESASETVQPAIDSELFRKYVAYAKRNVFPSMTDEARAAIREFYVDLRARGTEEDSPVPITARKLEALVRLAEASARVRLSDTVEVEDAERVIAIVRGSLKNIGVDPETGQFDADVIETGTSKTQRDRIKSIRSLIAEIEGEYEEGAPIEAVIERAGEAGIDESKVEHEIEKLRQRGEVYEPATGHLRTT